MYSNLQLLPNLSFVLRIGPSLVLGIIIIRSHNLQESIELPMSYALSRELRATSYVEIADKLAQIFSQIS